MEKRKGLYRELFFSTFRISACTFGGGYVIVPLMRKRFVQELCWVEEREMLDLISIAQSAPGPIAVNASLMIGWRVGGAAGALVAAAGTVLPPLVIISLVSVFYRQFRDNAWVSAAMRGMRAGVAAVLFSAVIDMGRAAARSGKAAALLTMAGTFAAVFFLKVNAAWVVLACAALGTARAAKERAA